MAMVMAFVGPTRLCLCAAIAVLLCCSCPSSTSAAKPNIVFIVADDLGYNDLGLFNGKKTQTPYLNTLIASEGMWLSQYYSHMSCAPSRASILTGRYGWRAGFYDPQQDDHPCLAQYTFWSELLQGQGYATHAIGKWDVGMLLRECTPTYQGFDSFLGSYLNCTHDAWYHGRGGDGGCNGTDFSDSSGLDIEGAAMSGPSSVNGTYAGDVFTGRAVELIETHNASKPLALYLAYSNAREACSSDANAALGAPKASVDLYGTTALDTWKLQGAMLTELDHGVANVTEALKRTGLYDNTLIVFVSDNGGPLNHSANSPLRGGKGSMYEGGLRVAAFLSGGLLPAHRRGTTFNGLVHTSDWYETLVEGVAGATIPNVTGPNRPDGFNHWPAFMSPGVNVSSRTVVVHCVQNEWTGKVGSAVRSGRYKLIRGAQPTLGVQAWPAPSATPVPFGQTSGWVEPGTDHCRASTLNTTAPATTACMPYCIFDLDLDLGESHDLSGNPGVVGILQELVEVLNDAGVTAPEPSYIMPGDETARDVLCRQCQFETYLQPLDWHN